MNCIEQRNRLRALVAGSRCHSPANIFDPLSARVAEAIGFNIGLMSGSGIAAVALGMPDLVLHTLTEYAEQVRRIARITNLSLLVDADHGYGNALNVMRTVEELEHAGVSAVCIEDTAGPMQFGETTGTNRLISLEEGVGKMRAAVAARQDPTLVVVARTPALQWEGVEGAVKRAKAYARAGVDMIFISGKYGAADIKLEWVQSVHDAAKLPLIISSQHGSLTREDLAESGVRVMLQGHQTLAASVRAIREVLTHLFNDGSPAELTSKVASAQEMESLTNGDTYKQWVREFMR